jgi:hypothetical protein
MTARALRVAWKGSENTLGIELMTIGAIGSKSGLGIDRSPRVDVLGVRELEQQCALLGKSREGQQIFASARWKCGVALGTDGRVQIGFKRILMAQHALLMAGSRVFDGVGLRRLVARAAVEFQHRRMQLMDEYFFGLGRSFALLGLALSSGEHRNGCNRRQQKNQCKPESATSVHQYLHVNPRKKTCALLMLGRKRKKSSSMV